MFEASVPTLYDQTIKSLSRKLKRIEWLRDEYKEDKHTLEIFREFENIIELTIQNVRMLTGNFDKKLMELSKDDAVRSYSLRNAMSGHDLTVEQIELAIEHFTEPGRGAVFVRGSGAYTFVFIDENCDVAVWIDDDSKVQETIALQGGVVGRDGKITSARTEEPTP